jgi:signal transduction histidine kinase
MYRRLVILSVIIMVAMFGVSWLGYQSITIWEKGLRGARLGEFAQAAEQIRRDVMRKLDQFVEQEQNRPYTDYQHYYIPYNLAPNQQPAVLISPLKDKLANGLAYGYFQIEPEGKIVTPYYDPNPATVTVDDPTAAAAREYVAQLTEKLLPALSISSHTVSLPKLAAMTAPVREKQSQERQTVPTPAAIAYDQSARITDGQPNPKQELKIESLMPSAAKRSKTVVQSRAAVEDNAINNVNYQNQMRQQGQTTQQTVVIGGMPAADNVREVNQAPPTPQVAQPAANPGAQQEMVNITIDPFVPVVINDKNHGTAFPGQVYLLRHVKMEDRNLVQGFQLDENKLLDEVRDSVKVIPPDMSFEISPPADSNVAYAATLSFGFGEISFGLRDVDPGRIARQIVSLRNWYFGTIAVVFVAVLLGLASVWRNVRAHAILARKKDDFISAVSHELRTPLTSIRMYTEMLERKWIKSEDKVNEYYGNMRQESERLSRLIENVLDFSRIQKGRKKFNLSVGDLNKCIADVIEMMKPYAAQWGFTMVADFGELAPTTFDRDAITQVVINLVDNAIKYSRSTQEKVIYVRTRSHGQYTLIEVEDRGPGVPHRERKKIFEQFYRIASEATRETNGTGLGLAIVQKFIEAHKGFVEVLAAKPHGALFRVGLPIAA